MNNLACNQLLMGSTTFWSVDFRLDLEIQVIFSLNPVLYFDIFSFINFCNFVFVNNMNLWVLMVEMLG